LFHLAGNNNNAASSEVKIDAFWIAIGVVGFVVLVCLIGLIALCCLCRKKKDKKKVFYL